MKQSNHPEHISGRTRRCPTSTYCRSPVHTAIPDNARQKRRCAQQACQRPTGLCLTTIKFTL